MQKYRTRPEVLEAIQVTQENVSKLLQLSKEHPGNISVFFERKDGAVTDAIYSVEVRSRYPWGDRAISTLIDEAAVGEWVIKSDDGEFAVLDDEDFTVAYELVEEDSN